LLSDLLCESASFKGNFKMPRLTVEQRIWVCIEFARVNNAEEVLRRWNNLEDGIIVGQMQSCHLLKHLEKHLQNFNVKVHATTFIKETVVD